jgi:glycopeptide antibiotics resistance protein
VVFPGSPRTSDINDMLLNTLGVMIGVGVFVLFARVFRERDVDGALGSSPLVGEVRRVVEAVG